MASISRRGKRWFAQVRKAGRPSQSRSFDSKAEAAAWAARTQSQLAGSAATPQDADIQTASLAELITRYINSVTRHKRGMEAERYRLNKIARHPIALKPIKRMTPADVAAYRDDRLNDVSAATVSKELILIRTIISTAQDEWGVFLSENPADRVRRPKFQNCRQRRLTEAEVVRLRASLATCRSVLPLRIFDFALETAMRRGEILKLKWRDLNLLHRTAFLHDTKNGEPRNVPLSANAARLLVEAAAAPDCPERVFPMEKDAFKSAWKRAVERSGVADIHFHDLRHEAISRFFELGLSLPEVAVISSHKDPRLLIRYTHIPAERIVQRLDGLPPWDFPAAKALNRDAI